MTVKLFLMKFTPELEAPSSATPSSATPSGFSTGFAFGRATGSWT